MNRSQPSNTDEKVPKLGRPPAGEIEIRKRAILSAATRLFIENGFGNTTLADIGKAAGVTKRTIYDHIGDKETLFQTVCMQCLPESLELHFEVRPTGETTREVLKNLAKLIMNYSLSQENVALARMLMTERMRFPDLVRQAVETLRELYEGAIDSVLKDMVEHGLLPPLNNPRIPYYFYDMIIGSMQTQMLFGLKNELPEEVEVEQRIDIFLFGLHGLETGAGNH
ncbi:hypothetical protein LK12_02255 [Novosphingobium malaysiense]|uniref:HTH tetR-type domain-containing protein n=2 Tax=Novosphingobium malaysiense TaxID=1348853 RepID=A0A0B1ZVH7_9SPHN|nr:hypothetical protein LK12_02255 [Novosphingobium malaysiense]